MKIKHNAGDRDNGDFISNKISSGNVNKFTVEEGEYDWLGQLHISNSMNITFKGNTKISNNNSITTLFNIKRNNFNYIKVNINGYGSSSNRLELKYMDM